MYDLFCRSAETITESKGIDTNGGCCRYRRDPLARLYGVTTDYLLCGNRRFFVDVSGLNEQEIAAIVNMVGLLRSKK